MEEEDYFDDYDLELEDDFDDYDYDNEDYGEEEEDMAVGEQLGGVQAKLPVYVMSQRWVVSQDYGNGGLPYVMASFDAEEDAIRYAELQTRVAEANQEAQALLRKAKGKK